MGRLRALLGSMCGIAAASTAIAATGEWAWPLDGARTLTSSFGEPRRTHLHAGIDLGTAGRTGIPCRAVGDGWVARLRMSPFGYGKALYVQLDDGPLVVYAHLERFAAPMAERAWQEQVQRGRYTFDIQLAAGEMRVQRGEIVAWSGSTGIGSPHLHFEVRDGDVATNPQTRGFALADAVPPVLQAVEVLPLDAQAHVEGECAPLVLEAGAAATPFRAAGRLGFAVRALDRAAPGAHTQVPYRYEVRIDGRALFRAVHERFDYADNHHIVLDYDQEQLVSADARFFLLFARAANRLPGREAATAGRGQVIAGIPEAVGLDDPALLGPGRHELEVEIADVAGQTRRVRIPFIASHVPQLRRLQAEVQGESLQVHVVASDADGDSLELRLQISRDHGKTWSAVAPRRVGQHVWLATLAWDGTSPWVGRARVVDPSGLQALGTCAPLRPERPGRLRLDVIPTWRYGRLEIAIASEALLAVPPRLRLHRREGKPREVGPLVQHEERRYAWVADVEDLDDIDGVEVEASAADGRRAILHTELQARIVRRGRARRVEDLHAQVRVDFERQTLLEPIALRLHDADAGALGLGPELRPAGPCVLVEPRTAALDQRARIRVALPETTGAVAAHAAAPAGVGLFMWERGQLSFLSARRNEAGELVGETTALGTLAVLRDTTPPVLRDFRCLVQRGGVRLQCVVTDAGADLGDNALQASIDGNLAIPEWDPENGQVVVHPTRPLAAGPHTLRLRAEDRLGNGSERTWDFTVPAPAARQSRGRP